MMKDKKSPNVTVVGEDKQSEPEAFFAAAIGILIMSLAAATIIPVLMAFADKETKAKIRRMMGKGVDELDKRR